MNNNYTIDEKINMYKKGEYVFKVPPVCCAQWSIDSWVKWIDFCNGWRPKEANKIIKMEV